MEQTVLQQRIEERAKQKLLKHLLKACELQNEAADMVAKDTIPKVLDVQARYDSYNHQTSIILRNEKSKEVFQAMLPDFIRTVTDEILEQIDQVEYLLQNKDLAQQEY